MRILFDQGVPVPLRSRLVSHDVSTAYEKGWSTLRNGVLLDIAERNGFEIFLTTDQNLRYEQNVSNRAIAVVVLSTTSWPRIKLSIEEILAGIQSARVGEVLLIKISRP